MTRLRWDRSVAAGIARRRLQAECLNMLKRNRLSLELVQMRDPRTIEEWIASRHYVPLDDPDAHSPLAYLAARKSIRRRVNWALLAMSALLLGCLARWYVGS